MQGWIKVFTGPMFSRKTEELLVELHKYELARKRVVLFKHSLDTRYGEDVVSHDGRRMKAIITPDPDKIYEIGKSFDVIGIDEAQFYSNEIVDVIMKLADEGKRVVLAGLDKNYLGKPFGSMPYILAVADEVVKLTAICSVCGEPATFSFRKHGSSEEILIGGADIYEPRCRLHRKA